MCSSRDFVFLPARHLTRASCRPISGYTRDLPAWDLAITLRKLAAAASTVFLFGSNSEAVTLQLLAVSLVLVISMYFQAVHVPFAHSELARLDELALFGTFNLSCAALVIFAVKAPPAASVVLQISILSSNAAVFVLFAGALVYESHRIVAVRVLRDPNGDGTVRTQSWS